MTRKAIAAMRILGLLVAALFVPTASAFAAEDTTSAPTAGGVGVLIFLIGLSAIALIGLTLYGRMMPAPSGGSDFEDDELIQDDDNLQ